MGLARVPGFFQHDKCAGRASVHADPEPRADPVDDFTNAWKHDDHQILAVAGIRLTSACAEEAPTRYVSHGPRLPSAVFLKGRDVTTPASHYDLVESRLNGTAT